MAESKSLSSDFTHKTPKTSDAPKDSHEQVSQSEGSSNALEVLTSVRGQMLFVLAWGDTSGALDNDNLKVSMTSSMLSKAVQSKTAACEFFRTLAEDSDRTALERAVCDLEKSVSDCVDEKGPWPMIPYCLHYYYTAWTINQEKALLWEEEIKKTAPLLLPTPILTRLQEKNEIELLMHYGDFVFCMMYAFTFDLVDVPSCLHRDFLDTCGRALKRCPGYYKVFSMKGKSPDRGSCALVSPPKPVLPQAQRPTIENPQDPIRRTLESIKEAEAIVMRFLQANDDTDPTALDNAAWELEAFVTRSNAGVPWAPVPYYLHYYYTTRKPDQEKASTWETMIKEMFPKVYLVKDGLLECMMAKGEFSLFTQYKEQNFTMMYAFTFQLVDVPPCVQTDFLETCSRVLKQCPVYYKVFEVKENPPLARHDHQRQQLFDEP